MRGRDPGLDHRASPYKPGSAGQVIDDESPVDASSMAGLAFCSWHVLANTHEFCCGSMLVKKSVRAHAALASQQSKGVPAAASRRDHGSPSPT
jgi:hypothetical protein